MSTTLPESRQLLHQARKFHTKKNLGQHFLVNAEALHKIVQALDLKKEDQVLEIGPGIGFLTRLLCQSAAAVTAVELDRESIDHLKTLHLQNLSIKHGDFLAYDIRAGRFREKGIGWEEPERKERIKVVGNVPYQITGLILGHLLGEIAEPAPHLAQIDRIVLTIQKEVAERMVALPGNKSYAQLSLLLNYFSDVELVTQLPAEDFFPPPRVNSAVVKITPLPQARVQCSNAKLLRRVIKAGFAQRRKMLRNALCSLGYSQDQLNDIFKQLQFDPQARAETLSLQHFVTLTEALAQLQK